MTGTLRWFSMSPSLTAQEHDLVSLEQALEIGRKYYTNAGKSYEMAEDAIADTMFGFCRDEKTFIELCVNGPSVISIRFETPRTDGSWLSRLGRSTTSIERTLQDLASMEAEISAFFSLSAAQFAKRLGA